MRRDRSDVTWKVRSVAPINPGLWVAQYKLDDGDTMYLEVIAWAVADERTVWYQDTDEGPPGLYRRAVYRGKDGGVSIYELDEDDVRRVVVGLVLDEDEGVTPAPGERGFLHYAVHEEHMIIQR